MKEKRCFKCGRVLPISDFYVHPKMADGHLNKCKDCTKEDVHSNYLRKSESEEYMNIERKRGRDKYRRLGYVKNRSRTKPLTDVGSARNVSRDLRNIGIDLAGRECHHWNYNYPKSVFILSRKAHKRLHKHLALNTRTGVLTSENGEQIKSVKQAKKIFQEILRLEGITEDIELYEL